MTLLAHAVDACPATADTGDATTTATTALTAKAVYQLLNAGPAQTAANALACAWLDQRLLEARQLCDDLPEHLDDMTAWMVKRSARIGDAYRSYLQARHEGAPRRYFSGKGHALHFLQNVAPTKLVDGAWLYGLLAHWDDTDFRPLIETYLEELGDGVPDKNHVLLYKKLLASHRCEQWQDAPDEHFIQGAIQLALAYNAERYLPEIVGYNLGYEQLPLHLLITAYELNELGIDPYYFTLHVTVDNGGTGHAQMAVQALRQLLSRCGDPAAFLGRVHDGYRLNDLGSCTTSVISGFDLEQELVRIMAAKAVVGHNMHSDYCRVGGRSINDWLADPQQIPHMLAALESAGWIQRGQPAENSRFWRLIQSERAEMFGVFNAYEQQILSDWIATPPGQAPAASARIPSYRARQRTLDTLGVHHTPRGGAQRGVIRHHPASDAANDSLNASSAELRQLEQQIASLGSKQAAMQLLMKHMSPDLHHSASGLMATRMFRQLMN
ncbi:iron-containing redox enzyme family protein [Duganella sp. CY15W]|uniref:iron-containing redox enzyme family protein n=1 Tax=Duganella sp. CY15W TaxID=2692172 RepID=UPI001370AC83|nr:iron-containing redox enzyme family protein [Duganella sp. CY15W]MYM27584.1 iron-containing redox enzyme family protein [Duganella sp. CY15W]